MSQEVLADQAVFINGYSHDCRGIASVDGKIHFVQGAMSDEKCTIKTVKKHSQFNDAVVDELVTSSPKRVSPKCEHFGVCGGCKLQYIDSDEQIKIKQAALLDQLQRTAKIQPKTILEPITGPVWQYRYKARLGVKYVHKKEKVLVGFREANSRYLADLNQCLVLHESIGEKIPLFQALIRSLSNYQQIPQLEVAVGDSNTAIVIRHLKPFIGGDIEKLKAFATEHNMHIYVQPKGPNTIAKLWPVDNVDRLYYELDELTMAFHPADFTQINPAINRKMVSKAIELLDLSKEDTVLDLFCGLGNFSLPIAKRVHSLVGVEGDKVMVSRCEENANANSIKNTCFYSADLFKTLPNSSWVSDQYDKLLIDPPRSGALEIISQIPKWNPKRIVYVSCNPATLARDTAELIKIGYDLNKAGVLDMFPHTSHVESIALFEKD